MRPFRASRLPPALVLLLALSAAAGELPPPINLPKPKLDSTATLVAALEARRSSREFATAPLPLQALSDLLWAANGVNREDGRRTAPTAKNWQEIDVYVVLPEGTYLFDAKAQALRSVAKGDLRAVTGRQDFVKNAPVNLVFVADLSKMKEAGPEERDFYAAADAGFVSQNVYLWCAANGLATVVRAYVDPSALAKALALRPDQRVLLAQSVGYPKK